MDKNKEHRTKNKRISTRILLSVLCSVLSVLLSGCLLVSGERASTDTLADGGNISSMFVGADGSAERSVETGAAGATLNTIVIVQAERGEVQVDVLNPDGSVVFAVKSRPDEQVTRQGSVQTDENGRLRYRVTARGARSGSYQVLYQRTG
jgi:hypothetical protein